MPAPIFLSLSLLVGAFSAFIPAFSASSNTPFLPASF